LYPSVSIPPDIEVISVPPAVLIPLDIETIRVPSSLDTT